MEYKEELRQRKKEIIGLVVVISIFLILGFVIHWELFATIILFGLWLAIHYSSRPRPSDFSPDYTKQTDSQ